MQIDCLRVLLLICLLMFYARCHNIYIISLVCILLYCLLFFYLFNSIGLFIYLYIINVSFYLNVIIDNCYVNILYTGIT